MNRITKLIEESEPSISAAEFFSTVVASTENMDNIFTGARISLLKEVLALDQCSVNAYTDQVRVAHSLQSLGLTQEGHEVLMHVKENIEQHNPHLLAWIENEIELWDKEVSDLIKSTFEDTTEHLRVFPKGTKVFIEGHTYTDEGLSVCFCPYDDRDDYKWITGIVQTLDLLIHATEMEENAVHDSVDHTGEHVQKEAAKRPAVVILNDDFDTVLKDYLESGKYFKVVRA